MQTGNKMTKNSQKFIIVFLVSVLILTSFAFFSSEKKKGVLAQEEEMLVCREPISIGSSLDATLEAMDVLIRETSNIHREVSAQIEEANAALASIGEDAANCDTSACQAMCVNAQAKITFKVTLLWVIDLLTYPACIPVCGFRQACLGKPCPSLDGQIELVTDSLAGIVKSIQKINDVFSSSTEQIEEDIMTEEESVSFKQCLEDAKGWWSDEATKITKEEFEKCIEELGEITKIEFAQRKLERTRADFNRWRMSQEDWEKAYRGEIIPRTTIKCLEALEERAYWPKWWTDDCEEKCKDDPYKTGCQDCLCRGCESTTGDDRCTDTGGVDSNPAVCQECLDQSLIHQYSWLKTTSCKFYGACRNKCEEAISLQGQEECLSCLCEGLPPADECLRQGGTDEECKVAACQKWICGESMLNWTGCYSY